MISLYVRFSRWMNFSRWKFLFKEKIKFNKSIPEKEHEGRDSRVKFISIKLHNFNFLNSKKTRNQKEKMGMKISVENHWNAARTFNRLWFAHRRSSNHEVSNFDADSRSRTLEKLGIRRRGTRQLIIMAASPRFAPLS